MRNTQAKEVSVQPVVISVVPLSVRERTSRRNVPVPVLQLLLLWWTLSCPVAMRSSLPMVDAVSASSSLSSRSGSGSGSGTQQQPNQKKNQKRNTGSETTLPAKRLTIETMSQSLRSMEYAVRGQVVVAADLIADELLTLKASSLASSSSITPQTTHTTSQTTPHNTYPFDHIVYTNIGNPHAVGQTPLTWPRQVLALVDLPNHVGIDHPHIHQIFAPDVVTRAREIKEGMVATGGSGAYSHSQGVFLLRQHVADFIANRDGNVVPATPESIFLTNGASGGIQMILQALISTDRTIRTGVMIPIPQYPIYSATLDLLEGQQVGYYLTEENGWALNVDELERSYQEATDNGITVSALVLINPGNPTGQVLSPDNVRDVVKFCARHRLVLLADEVYQENVYQGTFYSCKRAAYDCNVLDRIELVSFHSVSKGVFGECGRRGGYMELTGMDPDVVNALYKLASSSLCSTVSGQIMVSLMVKGPAPTDASFALHEAEKLAVYDSLVRKSAIVSQGLNAIDGISCQPAAGAMYCFPSIDLPPKAIQYAETVAHQTPDTLYCLSLLRATGICVVPASGFVQRPGRFGFRTTFLPPEDELERCVGLIAQHHQEFCARYQ